MANPLEFRVNPGSEYEPPTTPYPVPGRQFEPPTLPPVSQPAKRRRGWVLPVVAVAVVLLLGGGAGAYLVLGKAGRTTPGGKASQPPAAGRGPVAGPDVCAMLPQSEADRLVPKAVVARTSQDSEYTVDFSCNWQNRDISYGEYWRRREIDVRVAQYRGNGAKTGRTMAQNSYETDYSQGKYVATAKPSLDKGDKEYVSPVKDLQGIGDSAWAQYTWRRSSGTLWYSFGEAKARVGDFTIEVKFQASQQRKDALVLTNKGTQSINEANAIREVTGLIGHFAKGVSAWKGANPDVLAKPTTAATTSPSAAPSSSPSVLAAFPAACQQAQETAATLVPSPEPRARGMQQGADTQTECRWLNLKVGSGDTRGVRSVLITVHQFSNRAGEPDQGAAKGWYAEKHGGSKLTEGSSLGGITMGKVVEVSGLGDQAYSHYTSYRKGPVFNGATTVTFQQGAAVVQVDFAGSDGPKDEPTNSDKVKLLPEQAADEGALKMARAFLAAMTAKPIGS